jgi:hypothetical protein
VRIVKQLADHAAAAAQQDVGAMDHDLLITTMSR